MPEQELKLVTVAISYIGIIGVREKGSALNWLFWPFILYIFVSFLADFELATEVDCFARFRIQDSGVIFELVTYLRILFSNQPSIVKLYKLNRKFLCLVTCLPFLEDRYLP